jgi:hypothetical protein
MRRDFNRWKFVQARAYRRWFLAAVLTGLIMATLAGAEYLRQSYRAPDQRRPDSGVALASGSLAKGVVDAREAGEYDRAMELIDDGLEGNPKDAGLLQLRSEFQDDLKVNFNLHFLKRQSMPVMAGGPSGDLRLEAGDGYYYTVELSSACYLYVFHLNSSGELIRLVPNRELVRTPNPMPAGLQRIPDGFSFLHVKDFPGVEKIYLIATRWRNRTLEDLSDQVASATEPAAQRQALARLVARVRLEGRSTDKLPGLVYGEYEFQNTSTRASR